MIAVDLYERIDTAVVDVIRALSVPNVASVESQVYPDITGLDDDQLMRVSVHEDSESEGIDENQSADSESQWFPVRVSILDKIPDDGNVHGRKFIWLAARATIMNAFRLQAGTFSSTNQGYTLANCPEVKRCRIEPDVIFDPNIPAYQHVRTTFRLNFWCVCRQ